MEIQANGLTAIVNDDGSVDFVDADGTMQYRIGIPYMQDANHEVLNDIEVTATLNGDVWTVTYTPNEEWLTSEERAYPILLDPSVTTNEYNSNIIDTYVYEGNTANHSSEQHMYIGVKSGKIHRAYIKLNSIPSIDDIAPILSATMQLSFASGTTTGKTAQVYKASSSWNPSTLTYANQPALLPSKLLSTCDYNSSIQSLTFDITDDISKLNNPALGEPNYGYVVKYADESNVNPDYNMFCSMEHTNIAKRPVITINYGYTLPMSLINGGIYAFQNYNTGNFMAVENGIDANDVDVITEAVEETETSYQFSSRHLFKIEYIPSTGAYYLRAMCSSNGTNRVLDVVKYNGYPDYDSNVQIYEPNDPLAQHWLIIATGENRFKIVLRNAASYMLTEYTYSEDVALMFYVDDEEEYRQEWVLYNDDGIMINSHGLNDGVYYINNFYYGKFIHNASGIPDSRSGLIANLGDSIRWKVTYVENDYYTIQPMEDLTRYLYANGNWDVGISVCPTLSDEYLWKLHFPYNGSGMLIQNVATQNYLRQISSISLELTSSIGSYGTQAYSECFWRTASTSYYDGNELTNLSTISTLYVYIDEVKRPTINKSPNNSIWASSSDFTYSCMATGYVAVENGIFSGCNEGITTVIATHKPTNLQFVFAVIVGNQPTHSISNYLDIGYVMRFRDYPDVSEYYDVVCEKFEKIFGLDCYITYSSHTSSADNCKILQFGGVSNNHLADGCTHSPDHLTTSALRSGMSGGTNINTHLLWTGHILTNNMEDRSNSYGYYVVITPAFTTSGWDYENKSVLQVRIESIFELMHELSHQIGAPDHYCYGIMQDTGKCRNMYCDTCCMGKTEPRECMMSYRCNIETEQDITLYCSDCLSYVDNHLSNHH